MRKVLLLAAFAAAVAFPAGAQASIKITGVSIKNGLNGTLHYTASPTLNQAAGVGLISLVGQDMANGNAAVSFDAYCIDIFDKVKPGTFDVESFTGFSAAKMASLGTLLTHTAGFVSGATTAAQKNTIAAAIQMAVWELAFENSGTFKVGSGTGQGSFYMTGKGSGASSVSYGGSNSAIALSQSYINNVTNGSWAADPAFTLKMLVPQETATSKNQTQVFLINTPVPELTAAVPEPSTWALLIVGFGMVGGAMRKKPRTGLAYA